MEAVKWGWEGGGGDGEVEMEVGNGGVKVGMVRLTWGCGNLGTWGCGDGFSPPPSGCEEPSPIPTPRPVAPTRPRNMTARNRP